jgi:hypothetical protein
MYTLAPLTLMRGIATRDDLFSPRPHDRPVVKAHRKAWWKIGRPMKTERLDRPEPYGAYVGWFILGYGWVPGTQESARHLF